jgi:programmed cell death 6-interacting protein
MDILDSEASEDEAARNEISLDRLPSHEANVELIEKERRYRKILADAAEGDETIRRKWDEWEESIAQLMWDEVSLFLCLMCIFLIKYCTGRSGIISAVLYRRIVF